jgi:hypothetical protein
MIELFRCTTRSASALGIKLLGLDLIHHFTTVPVRSGSLWTLPIEAGAEVHRPLGLPPPGVFCGYRLQQSTKTLAKVNQIIGAAKAMDAVRGSNKRHSSLANPGLGRLPRRRFCSLPAMYWVPASMPCCARTLARLWREAVWAAARRADFAMLIVASYRSIETTSLSIGCSA